MSAGDHVLLLPFPLAMQGQSWVLLELMGERQQGTAGGLSPVSPHSQDLCGAAQLMGHTGRFVLDPLLPPPLPSVG